MQLYQGTGTTGHIFQASNQTITNLVLARGQRLASHHVPYTVVVVPVRGRIQFTGADFDQEIYPGKVVRMQPDEAHALYALEDSELMVVKSALVPAVKPAGLK
ncbi:cupin [Lactiplantibacillus modestisalitolerans]|uniref:Cupin n=1 Tax=Lactiplantibacillus modestisalitolerans TaxID=1457219 RepID=A0ABV5WUQ4_9LACO|nr:cupin [Lactiplantibacillus modestisalitolerans]